MTNRAGRALDLSRKLLLVVAGLAAVATPITIGLASAPRLSAQAQTAGPRPAFEVASIKPSAPGGSPHMHPFVPDGRLEIANLPLRILIGQAYDVQLARITGGPAWVYSQPWDVSAKSETTAGLGQIWLMLQTLLEDRFHLVLRRETREAPIYNLVAAKGGFRFGPSKMGSCVAVEPNGVPPQPRPGETLPNYCGNFNVARGRIDAFGVRSPRLAQVLSGLLDRPVADQTGFAGTFDVHLEFTSDQATAGGPGQGAGEPAAGSSDIPSIFTALQEQLGLKLDSAKGPVEMLVIEHVENPSAN